MARRALLVGINDYHSIRDLSGCLNDVRNMRSILKEYLGFRNNDIRVVAESRATKEGILHRLRYMVRLAQPGDFMVFHFSGHGSQILDRNNDELEDGMDELLCPWDMNWDDGFILDDDLEEIFSQIPQGSLLEVFLDCCHSGDDTRGDAFSRGEAFPPPDIAMPQRGIPRYLPPPLDIMCRAEGEEHEFKPRRGFMAGNRSGNRSVSKHILWSGCRADQTSADASIGGAYHGAFTYYFCKHMRATGGNISRRNLLERVRNSLRHNNYSQIPQLTCATEAAYENNPLQFPAADEQEERPLFLTTPYMRGQDVKKVQQALARYGFSITPDGVFGPHTHDIVKQFQRRHGLTIDGVVGSAVRRALFE